MLDRVRPKSHIFLDLEQYEKSSTTWTGLSIQDSCSLSKGAYTSHLAMWQVLQRVGDVGVDPEMSRRCGDGSDGGGGIVMGGRRCVGFGADRNERKCEGLSNRVRPEGEAPSRGRFTYQLFFSTSYFLGVEIMTINLVADSSFNSWGPNWTFHSIL
jgi:hypothetical protein